MIDNETLISLLFPRLRAYPFRQIFDDPAGVGVIVPNRFHFSILCHRDHFTLSWLYENKLEEGVKFLKFPDLNSLIYYLDHGFFPKEGRER